jgi:hypothetical protein
MFLQIFFVVVGSREVFKGHTTPLMAGFLMGCSAMLSELFFVLMCVFFTYGQVAATAGVGTFSLTTLLMVFVAKILTMHLL